MDSVKIFELIDKVVDEVTHFVNNSQRYTWEHQSVKDTIQVMSLLKLEILKQPEEMNERVLRSTRDIGMASYKTFENTPLENAIVDLIGFLYDELPNYKSLEPLRGDFGKENPI